MCMKNNSKISKSISLILFTILVSMTIGAQAGNSEVLPERVEVFEGFSSSNLVEYSTNNFAKRVIGPANSYPLQLHAGNQGKHIIGHPNYIPGRSIFSGTLKDADDLLKFYGPNTGLRWVSNKQFFSHGSYIGRHVDADGIVRLTKNGTIHWGSNGGHIIPGRP